MVSFFGVDVLSVLRGFERLRNNYACAIHRLKLRRACGLSCGSIFIYLFYLHFASQAWKPFTACPLHVLHRTKYRTNRKQISLRTIAKLLRLQFDKQTNQHELHL